MVQSLDGGVSHVGEIVGLMIAEDRAFEPATEIFYLIEFGTGRGGPAEFDVQMLGNCRDAAAVWGVPRSRKRTMFQPRHVCRMCSRWSRKLSPCQRGARSMQRVPVAMLRAAYTATLRRLAATRDHIGRNCIRNSPAGFCGKWTEFFVPLASIDCHIFPAEVDSLRSTRPLTTKNPALGIADMSWYRS